MTAPLPDVRELCSDEPVTAQERAKNAVVRYWGKYSRAEP
jgi:hypothetical protein